MNRIANITIKIIVIFLLFSLWGFYSAIRPSKIISSVTPEKYGVAYENISFRTKDNLLIRGWFIKSPNKRAKTLIFMHGHPTDKGDILPATIFLYKTYNLLYFDFRHLGKSEGRYSTVGKNEMLDLFAAIQYLHTRHINEVGVWGFSMGAAVALMTAPLAPEIKAVVADSGYARLDWMTYDYYPLPLLKYSLGELTRFWAWLFLGFDLKDVSPASSAEKIQIPVLLIHSKKDTVVPFKNALLLQKSLSHNPQAEIIFFDNAEHGEHFANYNQVVQRFYDKHFGYVSKR